MCVRHETQRSEGTIIMSSSFRFAFLVSVFALACSAQRPQEPVNYPETDARRDVRSYGSPISTWDQEEEGDTASVEIPAPTPTVTPPPRVRRRYRSHRPRLMCDTLPPRLRHAVDCWTMGCEEPFLERATRIAPCAALLPSGGLVRLPPGRYQCHQSGRWVSVTIPSSIPRR